MKKIMLGIIFSITLNADYFTGNELMKVWDNKYYEGNSMARGYFAGVQDSHNGIDFCVDSNVKMSQAAEVIIKYLKNNPEKWHNQGKFLIIDALNNAFPCKK